MRDPHLGGINCDFQSDLETMAFNKGEQLEDFHIRILILKQEINISGETDSPTILLIQYMKAFSNCDKLTALIASNIIYLITILDNNGK